MTVYRARPLLRADYILAGGEVVGDGSPRAPRDLRTGTVIHRGNKIAAILRGDTLIYWGEDGIERETCGSPMAAVRRLRDLLGEPVRKVSA
jgi:hypothetical protein